MSDLDTFLATPIVESLDPERTAKLISAPPFVLVPGVANVRDIGGWPARISNPDGTPLIVRKGRLYRAANLNHITPDGKEALHSLGVGAVFDLRTLHEVRKHAGVAPDDLDPEAGFVDLNREGQVEKDGIHIYHVPLVDSSKSDPKLEFAKLLQRFGNGDEGFLEDYEELLELGGQSFGSILRYIIEQTKEGSAGKACLWHCHGEHLDRRLRMI
jgi:Tyrosine phosphatase family